MKGQSFLLARIRALEARIRCLESTVAAMETRPQLRRQDLARKFGVSLKTISRGVKDRRLPRPHYHFGPLWTPAQMEGITLG